MSARIWNWPGNFMVVGQMLRSKISLVWKNQDTYSCGSLEGNLATTHHVKRLQLVSSMQHAN